MIAELADVLQDHGVTAEDAVLLGNGSWDTAAFVAGVPVPNRTERAAVVMLLENREALIRCGDAPALDAIYAERYGA